MAKTSLVITDIDGTIIKEGSSELNPIYYSLIQDLRQAGIKVIIASGRQTESIEKLFEPVLDQISIIGNGGLCIQKEGKIQMLQAIPRIWVEELEADITQLADIDGLYCGLGVSYAHNIKSPMAQFMIHGYRANIQEVGGVGKLPLTDIGKITLYHQESIQGKVPQSFWDKWQKRLHLAIAGDFWLDCVMPEVSKANALKLFLKEWGIDKSEIIATGDQMNDASMMKLAGRAIAVSNAVAELKKLADEVHENSDFLAVARLWQSLLA